MQAEAAKLRLEVDEERRRADDAAAAAAAEQHQALQAAQVRVWQGRWWSWLSLIRLRKC